MQQEFFVQILQITVQEIGGATKDKKGETAPPVVPSLVHFQPTPKTPIPHGFPATGIGGLEGAGIAGGKVSGLSGFNMQPCFGGSDITNKEVQATPRRVTLL